MASESVTIKRMSTASRRLRGFISFGFLCTVGTLLGATTSPAANAQSSTQKFTLTAVNFNGLSQYAPEQAQRAAELENGTSITIDDLANAAARLGKSGGFDAVNYRYTTHGTSLTAEMTV